MNNSQPERPYDPGDINVTAFIKESERFMYFYRDHQRFQIIDKIYADAKDPELSLTDADYLVLTKNILGEEFPLEIKQAIKNPRVAMRELFTWLQEQRDGEQ